MFSHFFTASCDVGYAVYTRYAIEPTVPSISYIAHLTGALAGLTIGLIVLKNFEQRLHEQLLWWVALGVYTACIVFAVVFNVVNYNSELFKMSSVSLGDDTIRTNYMYSRFGV